MALRSALRRRSGKWLPPGAVVPGDRLPSERTLVKDLDASRSTVRLVLVKLVAEGVVRAEHGRGYIVNRPKA